MKAISFYTGERYKLNALELQKSCAASGVECILYERPDRGTWWANCNQKCEVVAGAMNEFKGEPILWLDADVRIIKPPVLFSELDHDLAVCHFTPKTPMGAVIWFNGVRAQRYVDQWVKNVRMNPIQDDDANNLGPALVGVPSPDIYHLPPWYCWNEPSMRNAYPGVKEPVIIHAYLGSHDYPSQKSQ